MELIWIVLIVSLFALLFLGAWIGVALGITASSSCSSGEEGFRFWEGYSGRL